MAQLGSWPLGDMERIRHKTLVSPSREDPGIAVKDKAVSGKHLRNAK